MLLLRREGRGLFQSVYSADGQWLAVFAAAPPPSWPGLFAVRLRDGVPDAGLPWIPIVNEPNWTDKPRRSANGATLYFTSDRDGFRCIWSQRLDPKTKHPAGLPAAFRHFHNPRLSLSSVSGAQFELGVGRDRAVFNLAEVTGNIWSTHFPGIAGTGQ